MRLTIEQLAERVDKSTNYIGQIERNDGKPSLETIVDIANALGTTVDALLKDSLKTEQHDGMIQEISTFNYLSFLKDRKTNADSVLNRMAPPVAPNSTERGRSIFVWSEI